MTDERRKLLHELIGQCTEDEQLHFKKLYGWIDKMADERLDDAIGICQRTIKNHEDDA